MSRFFSKIGQRLAALGLLGLVLLLCWTEVVMPLWQRHLTTQQEIAEGRALLAKYQRVAVNQSRIAELVKEATIQPDLEEFLTGSSESVAVADLQAKLKDIAKESGAKLQSASPLKTKVEDGLRLVGLRLQLSGKLKNMQKVIYEIESNKPLLFIKRANIRRIPGRISRKDPGPTRLETRMDVYGVLWEGES